MTELIVPHSLIDKLGHNILEIRERALISLLSKIDNGYKFEHNLTQSKEMLTKLFEWFLFNPCPHEEMVLALIKRILLTDGGSILINHYGPNTIKKELKQVKECVEPQYQSMVQDLFDIVDAFKGEEEIPPLVSDVPLSYRSGQSCKTVRSNIGSTATSFGGYVSKGPSVEVDVGNPKETFTVDRNTESSPLLHPNIEHVLPNFTFRWQPLIEADRQVSNSLENSLRKPSQPSELLHSCEFFTDVLSHDFPAEVFLQRPTIVLLLQDLLLCSFSTRVSASVLNCLHDLTKGLIQRIAHCEDPSLRCLKAYEPSSNTSSPLNSKTSTSGHEIEFNEDYECLKGYEISTPKYCSTTLKCVLDYLIIKPESLRDTAKKKHATLYNGVIVIEQLLYLSKRCFCCEIFNVQPIGVVYEVSKELNQCLISFGDLSENYRIEVNANETNATFRAIQLCTLHHCVYLLENFIPAERSIHLLPKCFMNSSTMSLSDIPIARLYPELHSDISRYVQIISKGKESEMEKFQIVNNVCESMTAAVELMRNHDILCFSKIIALAKKGLLSLQFHENLAFVRIVIEACATKFNSHTNEEDALKMEDVLMSLFAHHIEEVVEYSFELCYKKVITAIGPMLNFNGFGVSSSQVVFSLRSKISSEVAQFGLSSKNNQVKKYNEDIVVHSLKCKILVTDEMWDKVRAAMVPSFPVLSVYASKMNPLGRTSINVVDPDIAKDSRLSTIEVIKCNILSMYSPEDNVRDEAFSRLCWSLAQQENSRTLSPRLNNINDRVLTNICQVSPSGFDVNKSKSTERFYQPSSLHHVMELSNSTNVEPGIRRSALTQIGVMMEDYLSHDIFIEKGGVETILKIMQNALIEEDYTNYADSVIPSVAILKSICLYNSTVRYELSHNLNLYYSILRGMFLFCTEERMKMDSSVLLFSLLYSSYIRGNPSRANMAIPKVVHDKSVAPVKCEVYGNTSDYTDCDMTEFILSDKSCLSSVQIHWNSEVCGGFQKMTEFQNFTENDEIKIPDQLKIQTKDSVQIKVSSVEFSIGECLKEMEKGECFENYEDILNALIIYVYLYHLWKKDKDGFILKFPWEEQFGKFLRILPSSEDDVLLLQSVIKFSRTISPFYKSSGKSSWIASIIKDPTQYLTDMVATDNHSDDHAKLLSKVSIELITDCACQEQHFIDFCIESDQESKSCDDWAAVIEMVTDNLKLQDPQQLYNLAHVDSLLSCLVHLSAMLGWSKARKRSSSKQTMKDIISGLCDLVDAFHYGKGPSAAVSLMGLSITRNVSLILNHILAEMHQTEAKNWDQIFVEDNEPNKIFNFVISWDTRDVVLRAAVLQFFAGLFQSTRLARDVVVYLRKQGKCLWSMTLNILLDNEESAIVRENAALILANLCTHRKISTTTSPVLHSELVALDYNKESHSNPIESVLEVSEKHEAVKQLKTIILCLYTNNISDVKLQEITPKSSGYLYTYRSVSDTSEKSWSYNSKSKGDQSNLVTPSLMKTMTIFLHNSIEMTGQPYIDYLNETGSVKLIFRSICIPSIEIRNTKELSLYIEILEMNSEICFFSNRAVRYSPGCLGTISHTRDCFNVFISLSNPKMYHTHLPQSIYLRNKVWTEMFGLIGTLSECGCQVEDPKRAFEILAIILEAVYNCGPMNLVATVCEAIESFGATELQISVLSALTLMLQIECSYTLTRNQEDKNVLVMKHSMKNLLDNVKSHKTVELATKDTFKNDSQVVKAQQATKYKVNLLERLYFGETTEKPVPKPKEIVEIKSPPSNKKYVVSGVQICKLSLHLYDLYDSKTSKESNQKQIISAATSSILCVSNEAKYYALDTGFLQKIIETLRELGVKLSLESVDCFRRISDKKRISPLSKDSDSVTGLLTNFFMENVAVKCEAASLGSTDIVHKVWSWFAIQKSSLVNVLKMLSTFTTNCPFACQTLPYTSSVAGTGPRKNTSSVSLSHVIVSVVSREMDMLSKTHDILQLRLCFNILQNCCPVLECRICITKTSLVQGMLKSHPSISKQQKPWETVELIWLEFLQIFTVYPEGQMYIGKLPDVLDLVISLTQGNKSQNRQIALRVSQNIAFYTPNRARLLTTSNFINTSITKLENGTSAEKVIVVNTMWASAANNMKAKSVFKSSRLDLKSAEASKKVQLLDDDSLGDDEIERMQYVLDISKDTDRCK